MYYQVFKLEAKPIIFTPDNICMIVGFFNSLKISDIDQLILALIFRFGVILV